MAAARDLVGQTYRFAQDVRRFVNVLPRVLSNYEDARQLVRASGSVAANYLEAQEALSRKEFFYRIKICRKEVREAGLWLGLVQLGDDRAADALRVQIISEVEELRKIFSTIVRRDDSET
jgi:four helix bundle protein